MYYFIFKISNELLVGIDMLWASKVQNLGPVWHRLILNILLNCKYKHFVYIRNIYISIFGLEFQIRNTPMQKLEVIILNIS